MVSGSRRRAPLSSVARGGRLAVVFLALGWPSTAARGGGTELVEWLRPRVDTTCRLAVGKRGAFVVTIGGAELRDEAAVDGAIARKAALCRVDRPAPSRVAFAAFATSMTYLRSKGTYRLEDKWEALVVREEYAARHGYAHWMWLGNLDSGDVVSAKCAEKTSSAVLGHVVKTLAVLQVLEVCDCDAVVYADVDSFPAQPDVTIEAYLHLDATADLIMSSQSGKPILMNSGFFILRNTPWAKDFLAEWWDRRCGEKDQLALWHVLFNGWASRAPGLLRADPDLFRNYSHAHRFALPLLVETRQQTWPALRSSGPAAGAASPASLWPCDPATPCGKELAVSRCVPEPMRLPNVLVLPVVAFDDGRGTALPPMQSAGKLGLFCHKHCKRGYDGSTYVDGCVGRLHASYHHHHTRPPENNHAALPPTRAQR